MLWLAVNVLNFLSDCLAERTAVIKMSKNPTHHKRTDNDDEHHEQGNERNDPALRTQIKHEPQLSIRQQILV